MRTVFFIPPLSRMSGGLATLYGVVRVLIEAHMPVAVTCPGTAPGLDALLQTGVPLLPWATLPLQQDDVWLVPESWPNAISPGVRAGARTIVYVQSWCYLLTTLPQGVSWKQLPVEYIAVSRPVAWFMRHMLGLEALGVLPPAVDPVFFIPGEKPGRHVRIAWMPRKNSALGTQVRQVAELCLEGSGAVKTEWVPLRDLSLREVAKALSVSHLFLCTGFPEGFGLPPVEAMAAGCLPVGFTGFGGWEYMRQPETLLLDDPLLQSLPRHMPPDGLHDRRFSPNGLYAADGDTLAAGASLGHAIKMAGEQAPLFTDLVRNGKETALAYSEEARSRRVLDIWAGLATQS